MEAHERKGDASFPPEVTELRAQVGTREPRVQVQMLLLICVSWVSYLLTQQWSPPARCRHAHTCFVCECGWRAWPLVGIILIVDWPIACSLQTQVQIVLGNNYFSDRCQFFSARSL